MYQIGIRIESGSKLRSPSLEGAIYLRLTKLFDMDGQDSRNRMICTCRLVVTTVITCAGLLRLHAEKSIVVHNCPL